ncbi:MAG TPA: hypothetical protein VK918_00590 [Pyrinomonadaceae bacterium]|nr:hypothetical protein [Pyrinomonadaceae bacterium]
MRVESRMRFIRGFSIVLFFVACSTIGYGQKSASDKIEDAPLGPKYTNIGLGFEMSLPKGWYVANSEELEVLTDEAWKDLKKGYKLSNETVLQQRRIENLAFAISKKRLGAVRNSAFGFGTVKQPNKEITALMVAQSTAAFFLKDPGTKLAKDVSVRQIDGFDFSEFDLVVTSSLGRQNVRVLIVNLKGYSLTFSLTYWNQLDDLQLMMSSIESLRFLNK